MPQTTQKYSLGNNCYFEILNSRHDDYTLGLRDEKASFAWCVLGGSELATEGKLSDLIILYADARARLPEKRGETREKLELLLGTILENRKLGFKKLLKRTD